MKLLCALHDNERLCTEWLKKVNQSQEQNDVQMVGRANGTFKTVADTFCASTFERPEEVLNRPDASSPCSCRVNCQ